jgi:hypothetical protein
MVQMKPAFPILLAASLAALPIAAQVKITPGPEKIAIEIDGKPFGDFYVAGKDITKPYLWPLRAATGTYVTRAWPMEDVEEEKAIVRKDHPHQRGMWFAIEKLNGVDFWNNDPSYTEPPKRGRVVLDKLGAVKSGEKSGSLTATFNWTDTAGHKILTETRTMTFYSEPGRRTIDVDITLTAVEKATIEDSKDSGFAIRLRPVLQEDHGTGHIVNADGLTTEKEAWGKPSNWCDDSGEINGEKVGVAILDNPANPGHPVRWHVRAYGLFGANPFGQSVFGNDRTAPKSNITLEPGQKLRYRYRVIIHPGDVKTADIAAAWDKYSSGK